MTIMEKGALVRALYTNHPETKSELFFRKGDVLTVIEYDHDGQPGWWLCALRGQRGICPSNYFEVLEDKYSTLKKKAISTGALEQQVIPLTKDESSQLGEQGTEKDDDFVNPLDTYDFPRSVDPLPVVVGKRDGSSVASNVGSSTLTFSQTSLASSTQALSIETSSSSTISLQEHTYSNEPLYENESVALGPIIASSESLEKTEIGKSALNSYSQSNLTNQSALDLYDVPRNELPILGQSNARLRKYGSCNGTESLESESLRYPEFANKSGHFGSGRAASSLGLSKNFGSRHGSNSPPFETLDEVGSREKAKSISQISAGLPPHDPIHLHVTLRRPHRYTQRPSYNHSTSTSTSSSAQVGKPSHSNRSSVQSEAESGIGMVSSGQMQDLYDVPRGTSTSVANLVQAFNKGAITTSAPTANPPTSGGNGHCGPSRPSSALSVTSSGMGLSIATSDSKDSLDCLYDVPRTAIKAYVNHIETKYDELSRHRHDSSSSTNSFASAREQHQDPTQYNPHSVGHSRHNSTSSIFSAYGYTRVPQMSVGSFDMGSRMTEQALRNSHNIGANGMSGLASQSIDELYDVPRGTTIHPLSGNRMLPPPPPVSRKPVMGSIGSIQSMKSVRPPCGDSNGSLDEDPMQFYDVPSQFVRKVSLEESTSGGGNGHLRESFKHGLNKGISSSSVSSVPSSHPIRSQRTNNDRSSSLSATGSTNGSFDGRKLDADVKILPLGPKAAVSVCEKLRQEVVSSITSILTHVKPKWRSKENLTEIMPDLKFSCTRLCLAIKDVADFASRSLSNAKRISDDNMAIRLHRLLTPVINGSQIIQRDVDELEAYFWSVDRLSVVAGHDERNAPGDALDQLILCSRSLKHDVTELANFLALHSSALYKEPERGSTNPTTSTLKAQPPKPSVQPETKVEDTQEDYDYVSLVPTASQGSDEGVSESGSNDADSQKLSSALSDSGSTSTVSWHLDSRDQQLLEFYSAQIAVSAPQLSQSISTFISAIQQNEPPSVFNIHLKYVILLGYKLLFAGDTVHRNIGNAMLKDEIEMKCNDLHKSLLTLYESSKVATTEFPKIGPMQAIVDRVWTTTQAATQLKKVIFNAVYASV